MKVGDQLTLRIEKPAAGGRMIARHDGAVVLVSGAIPGETVQTTVERVQRHTAWATATQVVDASPDRLDSALDPSCGGCVFVHVRYPRQLELKQEIIHDALKRIGRLEPPEPVSVSPSPTAGYRMRARLHVQGGRLGFFREGSHTICDPAATGQLLDETLAALRQLQAVLTFDRLDVLEVEVAENVAANERAVHLDLARDADASMAGTSFSVAGISGLSCGRPGNHHTLVLAGSPFVKDRIGVPMPNRTLEISLARHVRSFFQANRFLLPDLVASVARHISEDPVVDLYAGVGLFAVAAAQSGSREVIAIEGDRSAADDLKRNTAGIASLASRHQAVETFLAVEHARPGATMIVDPPRTGLSQDALKGMLHWRANKIVYVSCDVATVARDARALIDGGYRLKEMKAFDLFPNTAHVETVAVFAR